MQAKHFLPLILMTAMLGCQQGVKKQTANEAAHKQWNSTRAGVLASLSKDQYDSGNFDKARESINEAIKMDGENAAIRVISARIAIEQAQLEIAEKDLKLARQFDPRNPEADYLSGVVYQRWQKSDVAYDYYNHACEKAPAELSYLMAKTEMLVAMDRAPEALKLLQEKVQYFENSAPIRDAVGQLLLGQKKYVAAAESFKQATILSPDDLIAKEHLAVALYYAKEYEEAAVQLGRLVKNEKYSRRSDLYATLGESLCELGKFRDARDAFETAGKIDPGNAGIWLGSGKAALELGDLRRAELSLKKALSIDPAGNEANLLTGYLRLRQDRLLEALASFKKVSATDNQDTLSLCMTGFVLQKLGRQDEAIQYYGKALKRNPSDELATKLMAGISLQEQDFANRVIGPARI